MKRVLVIVLCFFMAIATVNLNYATVNAVANENLKIPIKSISCGNLHNLVVKEDGSVWGWGYNADKQLLVDCYDKIISKPTQIPGLKDIVSVSAGMIRNTAITNEGTVYTWGGWGVKNAPKIASGLSDIVKVSSSKMSFIPGLPVEVIDYTLALDSKGKVFAWGDNRGGIFANGVKSYESIENPIMLEELDNIVDIAASHNLSFVLNNNGEVFVVGDRDDNYEDIKVTCDKVSQIGKITAIHANSKNDCFALANDGSVWKIYCSRTEIKVEQIEGLEDIATLYIGYDAYFAKDNKGQLYAWGLNNSYYSKLKALIGNGTIENVKVPIKLDTIDNVYCVSSGSQNTLFVTNDGKLYVCGSNTFGTLGYNNQSEYLVPTKL